MFPSTPRSPSQADEIKRLTGRLSLYQALRRAHLPGLTNLKTKQSQKSVEHSKYRLQLRTTEQEANACLFHNLMDEHRNKLDRMAELNWLISYTAHQSDELNIQIENKTREMSAGDEEIVEMQRTLRAMGSEDY